MFVLTSALEYLGLERRSLLEQVRTANTDPEAASRFHSTYLEFKTMLPRAAKRGE